MLGLKFCQWCESTLWWWKEENKVHLSCIDGATEVQLCDTCFRIFEEFQDHLEQVKAEREQEDETI